MSTNDKNGPNFLEEWKERIDPILIQQFSIVQEQETKMDKKTAVIFGVTGQDGSYLSDLLLSKNYVVIGVYRRSSISNHQRIEHLKEHENFHLVGGDITDYSSVSSILTHYRPDEVYNLAAQSHVKTSFEQPLLTWDVTAKGCMNILDAIRQLVQATDGGYSPRFYQASSSEMFGDQFSSNIPTEFPTITVNLNGTELQVANPWHSSVTPVYPEKYQDENTVMNPQSPYAVAKLAAHNATKLYRKAYGLYTCSGILFNHESERRGENFVTRKITRYVAELQHARNTLYGLTFDPAKFKKLHLGNLDACRDWGHAEDYVYAMWLMMQQDEGDDYVIATGETHSVKDFLVAAFRHIGIDDYTPYVVIDPKFFRPSEVDYLRGNPQKAQDKLGWKPKHSFEGLVSRMVDSDLKDITNGATSCSCI